MTSVRGLALVVLACTVGPVSLTAQQRLAPAAVTRCRLSDSLLAGLPADGRLIGGYDTASGRTQLSTVPARTLRPGLGVREVGGSLGYAGRRPIAMPALQFELRVADRAARPLEERQLRLVLDDGVTLDIGSMTSVVQDAPPGGAARVVWQNLAVVLSPAQFAALARARTVRGMLGATDFMLTEAQHRQLRALYTAAVCAVSDAP